jgi:hypothetical protein
MKVLLATFFLTFSIGASCFAQSVLDGVVFDQEDSKPVSFAMVFLANTSIGTLTDESGKFSLSVPKGRFELVISKLGYQKAVRELNSGISLGQPLTITLYKTELQLDSLEIKEDRDPRWYQNLQIFKNNFLGQSDNSIQTILLNEKQLILDDVTSPGYLKARSNDPLKIFNKNLGYEIDYDLAIFELQSREKSLLSGGYPLFRPLSIKSKAKQKVIDKNREQAYHGSLMHFLRAVHSNTWVEEGFEVFRLQRVPNPDRPSDQEIAAMAEKIRSGEIVQFDLKAFSDLSRKPKFIQILDPNPLDFSKISSKNQEGDLVIQFEDYLFVKNTKFQPLPSYFVNFKPGRQESVIYLPTGKITIQENGNHFPAFDLFLEGYMSWLKIADLLPLDYWPNPND